MHGILFVWPGMDIKEKLTDCGGLRKCRNYRSDAVATIFFFLLHVSVRLLFEGGVYFFQTSKPADINDGWTRYVRARLFEAVSSKRMQPLSPAVSRVETSRTTRTDLALARWPASEIIRIQSVRVVATTIQRAAF